MIRRYGEAVKPGQQYRRRPGAYAVLWRAGRILTTFQQSPVPEFQLPGGGIDPGENPLAALHREVFEETGWKIDAPRRIGTYRRFTFMPDYDFWAEKVCTVWLARPVLRHGPPREPGHTAVWLSPGEALELLGSEGDRAMLARVLAGL
ncbi:NUDIX hydrolase [Paracoccus sp. IB05]|uniref:NUDIX hydrolase n=1 Tax=Paracoccus sp. IB05 TaxID=2779367 RepID=UPI0018E86124|nr:NUDIX hydrolase [Paracoccus sp. IB05]MBJ2151122.1 NUDIX hydrolase [Paracoccus sp. IB05]